MISLVNHPVFGARPVSPDWPMLAAKPDLYPQSNFELRKEFMPSKKPATIAELSTQLSGAVETAARSIVSIHARRRIPSTGVIWRDGVIVSASHTVRHDDAIPVTLPTGETITVRVAGRDPATDLIVLRVEDGATAGSAKPNADDGSAKVGALVLAAGRPGRNVTASFGIISAVADDWKSPYGRRVERLLRLDLAIYDGFSGGPLIDPSGSVIGINTSTLLRGAPASVPAGVVDRVVDELLERGHIRRAFIGVALHPVDLGAALAGRLELEPPRGLVILSIADGSPADRAGLLIGDIIVKANGQPVRNHSDFLDLLWKIEEGGSLELELVRGGEARTISVTPTDRGAAA
jgi:S1-C subfamily serine protease